MTDQEYIVALEKELDDTFETLQQYIASNKRLRDQRQTLKVENDKINRLLDSRNITFRKIPMIKELTNFIKNHTEIIETDTEQKIQIPTLIECKMFIEKLMTHVEI